MASRGSVYTFREAREQACDQSEQAELGGDSLMEWAERCRANQELVTIDTSLQVKKICAKGYD